MVITLRVSKKAGMGNDVGMSALPQSFESNILGLQGFRQSDKAFRRVLPGKGSSLKCLAIAMVGSYNLR